MEYRRLGRSGLEVSALSLGTWITFGGIVGRGTARELVARAFDAGVNFFDGAESYAHGRAEHLLGDVIADLRLPRDGFCVSSKIGLGAVPDPRPTQRGLSRKHLRDATDAALKRLRVDYLDVCFCHRPDPATPVEETVAAMDGLVRQGKVLYWGTSEWPVEKIVQAIDFARAHGLAAPSAEQPQYNLLHRNRVEREYAPLLPQLGLAIWSPLASGLLTGKYLGGATPEDSRLERRDDGWMPRMLYAGRREAREAAVARFVAFARARCAAPAPLAIAWCLANPGVSTAILGCSSVAQFDANLEALDWLAKFDPELKEALDAALGLGLDAA